MGDFRFAVWMIHFLADFFLISGVNCLFGLKTFRIRSVAAGVFGACFGAVCLLPEFAFLSGFGFRLLCLAAMSAISFGTSKSALWQWVMFFLLRFALAGAAEQAGRNNLPGLLLFAALLWLLARQFPGEAQRKYYPMVLYYTDRQLSLTALWDTGNCLCDPISGEPVLVVSGEVGQTLLGLSSEELSDPVKVMRLHPIEGLRLIPFHTVGCASGLLLALPMETELKGVRQKRLVAFASGSISKNGSFQALIGGNV